jgi:hypothetical protein
VPFWSPLLAHETEPSLQSQNSSARSGALRILASAFSGLLVGFFLSKLKSPDDKGSEAISPQDYIHEEQKTRQPSPALIPQIAPPVKQEKYTERRKRHTPVWKKLVEGSVALGTIGLLVVNYFQLSATLDAAKAAKKSSETAARQLEDSERIQAAHLIIENVEIKPSFTLGRFSYRGSCKITNIGGTLAQGIVTIGSARAEHEIPLTIAPSNYLPSEAGPSLPPSKSVPCFLDIGAGPYSEEDTTAILNGDITVFNEFELFYADIFGRYHIAGECKMFDRGHKEFYPCGFGHFDITREVPKKP